MGANEKQLTGKEAFLAEHQRKGEVYAGFILGKNGERDYHAFIVPEGPKFNFDDAQQQGKPAENIFVLSRREQRLAMANVPEHFKTDDWYWSSEQCAGYGDFAWAQDFGGGYQGSFRKGNELRVRLVRRVFI